MMTLKTDEDTEVCKGLIFRCYISSYISKYNSIEVRKSLRLLKTKSCPGCKKCDYILDDFQENQYSFDEDWLRDLHDQKIYKLIGKWYPGSYEYPLEGEMEYTFEEMEYDT